MQCPKCGHSIVQKGPYCPRCGAKLVQSGVTGEREVDWEATKIASVEWTIVTILLGIIPMVQTGGYAFFASPRQFSLLQARGLYELVGGFEGLAGDAVSSELSSQISMLNWLLFLWVVAVVLNVWGTYRTFGMRESIVTGIARRLSMLFALAYYLFARGDYSLLGLTVTSLAQMGSVIALCLVLCSWALSAWNAIRGFLVAFIRASR